MVKSSIILTTSTNSSTSSLPLTDPSPEYCPQWQMVTLTLDGSEFTIARNTLINGSGFFKDLLTSDPDDFETDFNIDADATLFPAILAFLRRGIFPIYYDKDAGHDHIRYHALLQEAKYFRIPQLENWLREKRYLKAVTMQYTFDWTDEFATIQSFNSSQISCHPTVREKQVYVCPRGIEVHRGKPAACGRQCRNARGAAVNIQTGEAGGNACFETEHVLEMLVVKERMVVNETLLSVEIEEQESKKHAGEDC
ncbi:hypothetical protein BP6252_06468 [Coleophoma cylindrospora]|uniref:BTB domain-containing protein n=1 Tax=Coleophoma cylindrospora TaxID=1849047 RepID=A0A3D8RN12_9HELO|nr:hypothetical protein BP6252_06468 [Coleophoma cylindrospora]